MKAPFTASGPAEVVRLIEIITPLVLGAEKGINNSRRQIFEQKVHVAMDNYFSSDEISKREGLESYYDMPEGSTTKRC